MATTTPTIIATMATTKMMGTAMAAAVALSLSDDAAPVAVGEGRAWHNGQTLKHIEGRRDYVPTHHTIHTGIHKSRYDHVVRCLGTVPEEMGCANLMSRVTIP